ncbi:response regulator [Sphingomonas sp.]|uniref:response regulator n=1 Tax=Sphingomonas sp. TaxID=28214 RepID=UPI00286D5F76|nr:response regulator [Sphingomonas sp.]
MTQALSDGLQSDNQRHVTRVLVVDPNKRNLAVLVRRLSEAGYRAIAADNGRAAIAELLRQPVDVVVAELYMAGISGAELARVIRGQAQWRDLPVMLITGKSRPNGAVQAYEAGADDVILKPFHFEVLFARIERRIARTQSLQALRDDNAALDARVVTRAIELGDMRDRWLASETERRRLESLLGPRPA